MPDVGPEGRRQTRRDGIVGRFVGQRDDGGLEVLAEAVDQRAAKGYGHGLHAEAEREGGDVLVDQAARQAEDALLHAPVLGAFVRFSEAEGRPRDEDARVVREVHLRGVRGARVQEGDVDDVAAGVQAAALDDRLALVDGYRAAGTAHDEQERLRAAVLRVADGRCCYHPDIFTHRSDEGVRRSAKWT